MNAPGPDASSIDRAAPPPRTAAVCVEPESAAYQEPAPRRTYKEGELEDGQVDERAVWNDPAPDDGGESTTGEVRDEDDEYYAVPVPMTPPDGEEGDPWSADSTAVSKLTAWEIYVPVGRSMDPLHPGIRNQLWSAPFPEDSETQRWIVQVRDNEATYRKFQYHGQSTHLPDVRIEDVLPLLAGATVLRRDQETLLVLLRELWGAGYECGDQVCVLGYRATVEGFQYPGRCRHWLYLTTRRVYLDQFESHGEYKLAQMLAVHRELTDGTTGEYQPPEGGWRYFDLKMRSHGLASEMMRRWPWRDNAVVLEHVRPVFSSLTGIVLQVPREKELWSARQNQAKWSDWDHGCVCIPDGREPKELGWAIAVNLNKTWVLYTTVGVEVLAQHKNRLLWCPRGNFANYVRRISAIDRLDISGSALVTKIAERDVSLTRRSSNEVWRARNTRAYMETKAKADPEQMVVIDCTLTALGVVNATGPYDCGKTTLIAEVVKDFRAAFPKKRIAIVSETNAAVEEDMDRLLENQLATPAEVVRLGEPRTDNGTEFVPQGVKANCYLRPRLRQYRRTLKGQEDARSMNLKVEDLEQQMLSRPIVIGTLSQVGKLEFSDVQFHLVINDEGAQTVESSLLQSMRQATEVLLNVGDLEQLLPYTNLNEKEQRTFGGSTRRHKIAWSLMHQFVHSERKRTGQPSFPGLTMTAEFRSHPRITESLSPFYTYELRDRAQVSVDYLAKLKLSTCALQRSWFSAANEERGRESAPEVGVERVIWLSPTRSISRAQAQYAQERRSRTLQTASAADPEALNLTNYVEVAAVVDLMLRIYYELRARKERGEQDGVKTVLIISPYRSQVRAVRQMLERYKSILWDYLPYAVETTDSSQGREAQITIASMVRNERLGFLRDYPARSLVSLSRSRDYLFVLACHLVYEEDRIWYQIMKNADKMRLPCYELEWSPMKASDRVAEWRDCVFPDCEDVE